MPATATETKPEATAPEATAPADAEKKTRNRKPTEFSPQVAATVSVHKSIVGADGKPLRFNAEDIGNALAQIFASQDGEYATQVKARTRKPKPNAKVHSNVASVSVYVAPKGHTFTETRETTSKRVEISRYNAIMAFVAKQLVADGIEPTQENIDAAIDAMA